MNREFRLRTAAAALLGCLAAATAAADDAAPSGAQVERPSPEAVIAAIIEVDTEAAKAVMKRAADFLAAQERFAFTAHVAYDVLQPNGQKLQFGDVREVTVRRPDRIRSMTRSRQGEVRTLYFDGKTISVDLPDDEAFIAVEKPGTLDAAIDYVVNDLDTPVPLGNFVKSNYYIDIADRIRSAYMVGTETIDERRCDHLAFRTDRVDVQLWIDVGDEPLPCGVVITYRHEAQSPQFRASFEDWDLSPKVSDKLFVFVPPKGSERIPVQAMRPAGGEAE